jgi:hypothetical protein
MTPELKHPEAAVNGTPRPPASRLKSSQRLELRVEYWDNIEMKLLLNCEGVKRMFGAR